MRGTAPHKDSHARLDAWRLSLASAMNQKKRERERERELQLDCASRWHCRQRKIIFDLFVHFIADTDTDENCFEINFSWQIQIQWFFAVRGGGHIADKNNVGNKFGFIADTDTEKYYFRSISAMNSDKR